MSVISLDKVTKQFGNNRIFDQFDFEITNNDFVCVVGPSGSGKSTLLNIIGLLERPTSGTVNILGYENPRLNSRRGIYLLRNEISYLFQNYGLIESETVKYNISLAMRFSKLSRMERNRKISAALEMMGLENMEKEKICYLSGGEQQRVALVKCMLKPARIILADEPTGSLDEINKKTVMESISQLHHAGKTVVLVTHDSTIEKYATKIIHLNCN